LHVDYGDKIAMLKSGQSKSEDSERSDNSSGTTHFLIRKMLQADTKLYGKNAF
jgi:hypothetical protein